MKSKLKLPKITEKKKINQYFVKNGMKFIIDEYNSSSQKSFKPNLTDLYYLHQILILNKRITVLEFGCGWSSLVMSNAIKQNKKKILKKINKIRKSNTFEILSLDNFKSYINICNKNYKKYLPENNNLLIEYADCLITTFQSYYCTTYKKKIDINPDFIYIDGPSQIGVKSNKSIYFNTDGEDLMPMSCDLLKMEFFLVPGTIVVLDGRGANANFLKIMFKRNWNYYYNKKVDQHYFILEDRSFGEINDKILNLYKNN